MGEDGEFHDGCASLDLPFAGLVCDFRISLCTSGAS